MCVGQRTSIMKVKLYYVYILLCSDGSYYTGFSNDPERRFAEHSQGIDPECYTYKRRPLKLVYTVAFLDPVEGIEFEKQIKRWSRAKKEALIRGDIALLKKLAKPGPKS
jgi:putative endonuclease